jgi:hypothetical protein
MAVVLASVAGRDRTSAPLSAAPELLIALLLISASTALAATTETRGPIG